MVKIRLTRMGDIHRPFYRLVVADSRYPRDGKYIEILGTYNPLTNPAQVKIDLDRVDKWIKDGAKPTDTARDIIVRAGYKFPVKKKKKTAKKTAAKKAVPAAVKETPKAEAKPAAKTAAAKPAAAKKPAVKKEAK